MKTTARIATLALVAAAIGIGLLVANARHTKPEHSAAPSKAATRLSDGEVARWTGLVGKDDRFPDHLVVLRENTDVFVSLVLRDDPPTVVISSLYALGKAYTARPEEAPRLAQAVMVALNSQHDSAVCAALEVAKPLLVAGTAPEIAKRLPDLGGRLASGAARFALIDVFFSLDNDSIQTPHLALAEESLRDKMPFTRSQALRFLDVHSSKFDDAHRVVLAKAVASLLTDVDPGVRGRAAILLAALDRARTDQLRPLLKDPVPLVQAQACTAMARADLRDCIPDILQLTTSLSIARHDIRGWTTLDGQPGVVSHTGSASGFLGDAAATALALLSHGQVTLEPIDMADPGSSLQRNRQALTNWAAKESSAGKNP